MSVENRIFWLLIAILALFVVLSTQGRGAVNRFIHEVFGYTVAGSAPAPAPTPAGPSVPNGFPNQNPDAGYPPVMW